MQSKSQQQTLRSLRRSLNRAVTCLRQGDSVRLDAGRRTGVVFRHPWLLGDANSEPPAPSDGLHLFLPGPTDEHPEVAWGLRPDLLPVELKEVLSFYWPGPLVVAVRVPGRDGRIYCTSPRQPMLAELLRRHGPLLWSASPGFVRQHYGLSVGLNLEWPEERYLIPETVLDVGSRPWRFLEVGFLSPEEISEKLSPWLRPIMSADRASPMREARSYRPAHRTVVLEAGAEEELSGIWNWLKERVAPDISVRLYVDAKTAHRHYPDYPAVKVFGDLEQPERIKRRLEAMLERQRQRAGKRLLVIALPPIDGVTELLRTDLGPLAEAWYRLTEVEDFNFAELWSKTSRA